MEVQLGQRVKDSITGLEGVVIAITRWLNGCTRITVQPEQLKDGCPVGSSTFDEPQVRVITAQTEHNALSPIPNAGGDQPAAQRAPDPR